MKGRIVPDPRKYLLAMEWGLDLNLVGVRS